MPPRTRTPRPAPPEQPRLLVEVDAAALTVLLNAVANTPPSQWHPNVCRAAVQLEGDLDDLAGPAGILDIGWGLRASDEL